MSSCRSKKEIAFPVNNRLQVEIPVNSISKERARILKEASEWIGTPYQSASAQKNVGTDCSGMVMSVYDSAVAIKIPRNSAKQAQFCKRLTAKEVRPGDLVFFATGKDPSRVSHVGIMLDADNFIHAGSKKGVAVAALSSPYFQKTFICFGRVPGLN